MPNSKHNLAEVHRYHHIQLFQIILVFYFRLYLWNLEARLSDWVAEFG